MNLVTADNFFAKLIEMKHSQFIRILISKNYEITLI